MKMLNIGVNCKVITFFFFFLQSNENIVLDAMQNYRLMTQSYRVVLSLVQFKTLI